MSDECQVSAVMALTDLAGTRKGQYATTIRALSFISIGTHTYFGTGETPIAGKITLAVGKQCSIEQSGVKLCIRARGQEVLADLVPKLNGEILRQTGKLSIDDVNHLFRFPSADSEKLIDPQSVDDQTVQLCVRVTCSKHGKSAESTSINCLALVLFDKPSRFSGRDPGWGGDGWARPRVRWTCERLTETIPGFAVNDFSYMHGGDCPDHHSHTDGTHVDIRFTGYQTRDGATLATIESIFNDKIAGAQLDYMYVAVTKDLKEAIKARIAQYCSVVPGVKNPIVDKCVHDSNTPSGTYRIEHTTIKDDADHWDHFHIHVFPERRSIQ